MVTILVVAKSLSSICKNTIYVVWYNMIEVTEEEFQEDLTKYTTRIENGEDFLVKKKNGSKYIATDVTKFDAPCDI